MGNKAKDPSNWVKTSYKYVYYKLGGKEVAGYASIDLKPGHVAMLFLVSRLWDT